MKNKRVGFSYWMITASLVMAAMAFINFAPSLATVTPALASDDFKQSTTANQSNVISQEEFLKGLTASPAYSAQALSAHKDTLKQTALATITAGEWVVPSESYSQMFARDSFWVLLALKNKSISEITVQRFRDDQQYNSDGHIATALYRNGARPEDRDRDEESTMMYVLHNLLLHRLGGEPDLTSLQNAYRFIQSHVVDGSYYTNGETRFADSLGGYHYWADTLITPRALVAYDQGLYAVSLAALKEMGVAVDDRQIQLARQAYAKMVNPLDGTSLPLMEGSTITDVSALTGEALSLLLFNQPILSDSRVQSTVDHLQKYDAVNYADGQFLGFKVIADFWGGYRPTSDFLVPWLNTPGNYQNGASWFLYDEAALYAASRHGIKGTESLMLQRIQSEFRQSQSSHEFIRTSSYDLGGFDKNRDGYGWNAAVLAFLP